MAEAQGQPLFDRYEAIAVIVPGASLLLGLWWLFPGAVHGLELKDISLGAFGVFTVAAFCVGHIIQAPANVIVDIAWRWFGRPTERMRRSGGGLADQQVDAIPVKVKALLGIDIAADAPDPQWRSVIAQVSTVVTNGGNAERLEKFNGNYGLFRGLTVVLIILTIVAAYRHDFVIVGVAAIGAWSSRLRMKRFSVYYAREMWLQFLSLANLTAESSTVAMKDLGPP